MKRLLIILCAALAIISLSVGQNAYAGNYEFSLNPGDLNLSHDYAYSWGISLSLQPDESITGVSLTFNNLNNWGADPNFLYINLLESAPLGIKKLKDKKDGNYFEKKGLLLDEYIDSSPSAEDYIYFFTEEEILALNKALNDGVFGFGLDPDCQYNENGATAKILTTQSIPEPGTLVLLGSGLAGLAFFRRYNLKK
jgi:hypothetical protein